MEPVFFIIRLPVALLGYALVACLAPLLMVFWCLAAVFTIVIIPFMLVKAAFENDVDVIKKPIKEITDNVLFLGTVREMFSDVTDWLVR